MNNRSTKEEIQLMKPFLPPVQDILPYLERIWESRQLTNGGPVHHEFEQALCDYLGVKYISLFANGTLALLIALKTLNLRGEVITTPFTYPSTLQAIYWNNLTPVFADIDPLDFNIDIDAIEAAITPRTSAILAVHIFGSPCNVEGINRLALKYNLKIIYDAAHCFGVRLNSESICNAGDLSVLSFHATKVFNTFEGGAIVCHDETTKKTIDALKNSGIDQDNQLIGYGINAKMNEFQAAAGLCQLKYIDRVIENRRIAAQKYTEALTSIKGLCLPRKNENIQYNYAYFPLIIHPEEFGASRDELADYLAGRNIVTRKYFYPLVSDSPVFGIYKTTDLPNAAAAAGNILNLPLYHDISAKQIELVVETIRQFQLMAAVKTSAENIPQTEINKDR